MNARAIGIDFDNVGRLFHHPELGASVYLDWYGHRLQRDRLADPDAAARRSVVPYQGPAPYIDEQGRAWEPHTSAQMATFMRLVDELVERFPVLADPRRWVGHYDIRATKTDPGPHFPWVQLGGVLEGDAWLNPGIDWATVPGVVV